MFKEELFQTKNENDMQDFIDLFIKLSKNKSFSQYIKYLKKYS